MIPQKDQISLLSEKDRHDLLRILHLYNPNPKSALNFSSPFELLCAVVLSAQTTDKAVNTVTEKLFKVAPTPQTLAKLSEDEIASYIKKLGLWQNKSKNLKALALMLLNDFNGDVPQNFDDLIKLPGVGAKTANVVLNVAFNKPTIAVDTHIFRVCNRTGFCLGKSAEVVQKRIPPLVCDEFKLPCHHLLLLHGRHVCTARNPKCNECVIRLYCKNYKKDS